MNNIINDNSIKKDIIDKYNSCEDNIKKYLNEKEQFEIKKNNLNLEKNEFNSSLNSLKERIKEEKINQKLNDFINDINKNYDELKNELDTKISDLNKQIEDIKKEMDKIQPEIDKFKKYSYLNKNLQEKQKKMIEFKKKKETKEENDKEINNVYNNIQKYFNDFKSINENFCSEYSKIIEKNEENFNKDYSDSNEKIKIRLDWKFNKDLFENKLQELFDFRRINYNKIKEEIDSDTITIVKEDLLEKERFNFKNKTSESYIQYLKIFTQNFYENYLTIEIIEKGSKIDFSDMSEGTKAILLLKILIMFDDKSLSPILIDQPEDDLDNKSICNRLTNYIKKIKHKRQIIIVTHNANLVIGCNSDEVIVTKKENSEKFNYKLGSIEEKKNDICEILEGGKEAFEKREKRLIK